MPPTLGLGIVEQSVTAVQADSIGSYDDRWRFRWGLYADARPRENSANLLGWESANSAEGWQLDLTFPEVPNSVVRGPWATCVARRWKDRAVIFMLEARSGILGLRRAVRREEGFHKGHVLIGDSNRHSRVQQGPSDSHKLAPSVSQAGRALCRRSGCGGAPPR